MGQECKLTSAQLEEVLASAGLQATSQRLAITRFVLCEAKHPSANDVKAWADKVLPKVSLATVYNTLNALVKAGLLQEFRFPHTDKVIYDNKLVPHFHFVDDRTGELVDIDPKQVSLKVKLPRNYKISEVSVLLKGTKKTT